MRSAVLFLPRSITLLMNIVIVRLPYLAVRQDLALDDLCARLGMLCSAYALRVPYLLRPRLRFATPCASSAPRMMW